MGSPHVHSSYLIPVSFAGLLIKCLHFTGMTWAFAQVRPHVALRGRLCAVWDILARGVARPGYYRLFYPYLFIHFCIHVLVFIRSMSPVISAA